MPTSQFNLEEYFSGYPINWDAIRKYKRYREHRRRTRLLYLLGKKVACQLTFFVTSRK